MVTILIDGRRLDVDGQSRLKDILPAVPPGCCVAVIRPAAQEQAATNSLAISTTAGEITVEVAGKGTAFSGAGDITDRLLLHWQDRYAAAFGPFPSAIRPERRQALYERGDVILGCGGYDPQRSYLVFSKIRHSADHGADESGGVIGSVVSGRAVLDRWSTGDRIIKVEPVISWADTSRSFTTTDFDLVPEEGMQVVTRVDVTAHGYSPEKITTEAAGSVEHLLFAQESGTFAVSRATSTHILDATHAGVDVPAENRHPRREGTVTVRNSGPSSGGVYIYRSDVQSSPAHSVVGHVVHGIELVKLAKDGDTLSVTVRPARIDLLGVPLPRAEEIARDRGFTLHADSRGADRIVVSQEPGTTLDVLNEKAATVVTAPESKVVDIVLDDAAAPASCATFRRLTGLADHDAGMMPLFFKFDDVFLFKPGIPADTRIIPENLPAGEVPAAALAITNDSRKGSGMVGVRLSANREFGPTSEPFEGTNIIGTVTDTGKLKNFKERETVYIREVGR
ncbi:MAG: methanogenesis marker 3 protein [Methanoregula sp.]|nr:MAG: methanogenesis marker 3 protein [Methanoregula sp.]